MSFEMCMDLLKDLKKDADEIRFSDDARLKELFEMSVTGDKNRVLNAEAKYREALDRHERLKLEAENERKALNKVKEELREIEKECEALEGKTRVPVDRTTEETMRKLREEIRNMQKILKMYKDFTGVRFLFRNYPEAVVGYVIVKGPIPTKSVLRPFYIKKPYTNACEEIWSEIFAASAEI